MEVRVEVEAHLMEVRVEVAHHAVEAGGHPSRVQLELHHGPRVDRRNVLRALRHHRRRPTQVKPKELASNDAHAFGQCEQPLSAACRQ